MHINYAYTINSIFYIDVCKRFTCLFIDEHSNWSIQKYYSDFFSKEFFTSAWSNLNNIKLVWNSWQFPKHNRHVTEFTDPSVFSLRTDVNFLMEWLIYVFKLAKKILNKMQYKYLYKPLFSVSSYILHKWNMIIFEAFIVYRKENIHEYIFFLLFEGFLFLHTKNIAAQKKNMVAKFLV